MIRFELVAHLVFPLEDLLVIRRLDRIELVDLSLQFGQCGSEAL